MEIVMLVIIVKVGLGLPNQTITTLCRQPLVDFAYLVDIVPKALELQHLAILVISIVSQE